MSESLDGMYLDKDALVIQLTGGGCAERFKRGMDAKIVANRLRYLADRIDWTVEERARQYSSPSAREDV